MVTLVSGIATMCKAFIPHSLTLTLDVSASTLQHASIQAKEVVHYLCGLLKSVWPSTPWYTSNHDEEPGMRIHHAESDRSRLQKHSSNSTHSNHHLNYRCPSRIVHIRIALYSTRQPAHPRLQGKMRPRWLPTMAPLLDAHGWHCDSRHHTKDRRRKD